MDVTGSAQHDAWRARALLPVEQLRPDLCVYAFAFAHDGGGLGPLDTGWESDVGWTALSEGPATPGHLCFAEECTGLFFSGDHVLPRINPNISTTHDGTADPLGDYPRSLAGLQAEAPAAAPAGEPVEGLPAPERRRRGLVTGSGGAVPTWTLRAR